MRSPLQILYLILVTDLPPSIALAFEPGEADTMKKMPRPKSEPIVKRWMWISIAINGMILAFCILCIYVLSLWAYAGAFSTDDITNTERRHCTIWEKDDMTPTLNIDCSEWTLCSSNSSSSIYDSDCSTWKHQYRYQDLNSTQVSDPSLFDLIPTLDISRDISELGALYKPYGSNDCKLCIDESIRKARTCAFISLVWAENLRAYTCRSFETGVWVRPFENASMNYAIALAQAALYLALFIPGLNTVLGLYPEEIYFWGWLLAFFGAISCLVMCEMFKIVARFLNISKF